MTTTTSDISVVICTYTEARCDELTAAVESVRCQSSPALEIIVVIDHNPHLFEQVQARIGGVVTVQNRGRRGLSGARNTGIETARGSIVALLDDDAVAAPDWLAQLNAGYDDPRVLVVGGSAEPVWVDGKPGWFPEEFH